MPSTLTLTIETPQGTIFNEPVSSIHLTNELGDMEIFPGHATLLASISFSKTRVRCSAAREELYFMRSGILRTDTQTGQTTILVESCTHEKDIEYDSIKDYEKFVLDRLSRPAELSSLQITYLTEQKSSLERMIKVIKK